MENPAISKELGQSGKSSQPIILIQTVPSRHRWDHALRADNKVVVGSGVRRKSERIAMLGRLHFCLLLACTTLTAGMAHGQSQPPPPGGPVYLPNAGYPAYTDPAVIQELLPADRGGLHWDTESPFRDALRATSHGAFVRVEYLNTHIDDPGRGLLGAPLANVPDPRQPFITVTPSGAFIVARVADLSPVDLDNINGIRTTFGIPLRFGLIEASIFGTEKETSTILARDIPQTNPLNPVQAVGTSLFTAGALGSTVVLHDEGFVAPYTAEMFGIEGNFFYSYRNPRLGMRVLPFVGFRHIDYDETLAQRGLFSNTSGAATGGGILFPPLVRSINSVVDNNLYTGQLGVRIEFAHQWVTLGVEPKVGLGINHYEATVQTANLRDSPFPPIVDDGVVTSRLAKDNATATFDLQTYADIHVNHWLNLRVGWTFTWLDQIARANDVIYYNDNGVAFPPAISTRANSRGLWMSSITVGGEIVLP